MAQPQDTGPMAAAPASVRTMTVKTARGVEVSYGGKTYLFQEEADTSRPTRRVSKSAQPTTGLVRAPMAGVVTEILVCEGDIVSAYQPVAVVEAMKVLATLEAPVAGVVKHVAVKRGSQLVHGETLIEIEPDALSG